MSIKAAVALKNKTVYWFEGANIYPRVNIAIFLTGIYLSYRLAANYILNQYYSGGAQQDTNVYSALFWHCDIMQNLPGVYLRGSYLKLHFSFFSLLPCSLSHILPVERIPYTASVMGALHALVAFTVMLLLHLLWPARTVAATFLKAFIGFAFSLNPCAQAILSQAHVELAAPPLIILFMLALVYQRHGWAILCLILALSVREDIGFHIFGLIFVIIVFDYMRGLRLPDRKIWIAYALAALAYGIFSMLMMRYVVGDYGNMKNVYLGSPWFSHLTPDKIDERMDTFFNQRSWIWLPYVVVGLWALVSRNWYIALGHAAFIPWLLLSLAARSVAASHISIHYSYPFLIAGMWPLIALLPAFAHPREINNNHTSPWVLIIFGTLFFFSQQLDINLSKDRVQFGFKRFLVQTFPLKSGLMAKPALEDLERRLTAALPELRRVKADNAMRGIAPYAFDRPGDGISMDQLNKKSKNNPEGFKVPDTIDALIMYEGNFNWEVFKLVQKVNNLHYRYWLPGTRVQLVTNFDLSEAPTFNQIFLPWERPSKDDKQYRKINKNKPPFFWEDRRR